MVLWSGSNTQHKLNLGLVAVEKKLGRMSEVTKLSTMCENVEKRLSNVEGYVQGLGAEVRTHKACCLDVAGSVSRSFMR